MRSGWFKTLHKMIQMVVLFTVLLGSAMVCPAVAASHTDDTTTQSQNVTQSQSRLTEARAQHDCPAGSAHHDVHCEVHCSHAMAMPTQAASLVPTLHETRFLPSSLIYSSRSISPDLRPPISA